MSQDDGSSKTPKTIKIAPKEPHSERGSIDPGPGDMSAQPSEAPQLVDIPPPPTPSELVVKSGSQAPAGTSRHSGQSQAPPVASSTGAAKNPALTTLVEGRSQSSSPSGLKVSQGPKSIIMASMSNKSRLTKSVEPDRPVGAPREPTSSMALTGPMKGKTGQNSTDSVSGPKGAAAGAGTGSAGSGPSTSKTSKSTVSHGKHSQPSASPSSKTAKTQSISPKSTEPKTGTGSRNDSVATPTASMAMQADSGALHDEDEEGEGEVEVPEGEASSPAGAPSASPSGASTKSPSPARSGRSSAPTSPGAGSSGSRKSTHSVSSAASEGQKSDQSGAKTEPQAGKGKGSNKKVTKFRYHKRITVRTSGKTSPTAILQKVNKKNHQPNITPSRIDELDPQELMKRAGVKNANNQTHWRVRLRQTKRITKNGKTTTQTKVAYRDSKGNKHVRTSADPFCKNCNKNLEDCKCDTKSHQ